MVGSRLMVGRSRGMVGCGLMVGSGLVVGSGLMVGGVRSSSVSLPRGAVDIVLVVAGAEVFVEEGSIATVVGVLLAVLVAEVVDLEGGGSKLGNW